MPPRSPSLRADRRQILTETFRVASIGMLSLTMARAEIPEITFLCSPPKLEWLGEIQGVNTLANCFPLDGTIK